MIAKAIETTTMGKHCAVMMTQTSMLAVWFYPCQEQKEKIVKIKKNDLWLK